jgi:hypothetical protein
MILSTPASFRFCGRPRCARGRNCGGVPERGSPYTGDERGTALEAECELATNGFSWRSAPRAANRRWEEERILEGCGFGAGGKSAG